MNTFCTLIVTESNRDAANDLINSDVFNREATDGENIFWFNSGAFLSSEVTALVNSDLLEYADFSGDLSGTLESQGLTATTEYYGE